ncbi:MAG: excinuclease ABC subunit UvrC [Clostridiales bacterium]|nr:excinuclease ABC subunit UvrC [Clostridiales bacterium]
MNERLSYLQEKANKLPLSSGVYQMKDRNGKIIYIGKAKALKNRVTTYFHNSANHNFKTQKLVEKIFDFDFIVTESELDALVLEASLIKHYSPKYNILLKDDKGYNYVRISGGEYPKITYALQKADKNSTYLGPYTSGYTVKQAVEDANKIFMLPNCNRVFPRDFKKERPCLNYHIKRCMGVCLGNIKAEQYQQQVRLAVDYIKNGSKDAVKRLTNEMNEAAEALEFERAARIRDQLKAIERLNVSQTINASIHENSDIIAFSESAGLVSVAVILYRNGKLVDKENYFLGDVYSPDEMRSDFIVEYYSNKEEVPKEILLDETPLDELLVAEYLRKRFDKNVKIHVPQRGEALTQVMLAKNNASEYLSLKIGRTSKEITALEDLKKLLALDKVPERIESYDISNFGETGIVGGMVVYINGRPEKSLYRKFAIKEVVGQDDYASMCEVIRRRLNRFLDGDSSFSPLPDLILLDGGKGHVSAVSRVLEDLKIDIPLFGLVKDKKHRTRAIAKQGGEIEISANKNLFSFLTKIQDEVHRFSLSFQRVKHKKTTYALELTKFSGIGEKKAEALLKEFKTKKGLRQANAEELAKAAKISIEKAEKLKQYIENIF